MSLFKQISCYPSASAGGGGQCFEIAEFLRPKLWASVFLALAFVCTVLLDGKNGEMGRKMEVKLQTNYRLGRMSMSSA